MNRTRLTLTILLAAVLAAGPGCIKRSIGVRSDPPGAFVYLDGLEVGKTPVDGIRFDFYGTRELALYKDGYLVERRVVKISTPWYATFPLDVATDLLNPWDIADRRDYYFALKRTEPAERSAVLRHAHETRETARARIASARIEADYKPRTVVVKDAEKRFFLWGWMFTPPRGEPVYMGEEPAPKEKTKESPKKDQ
jgi:hypothetical protein